MKPYYEQDGITIFHADCRDVLPLLATNSVDLVLTDPPYFQVKDEAWDRQWTTATAFISWLDSVMMECHRLLKPNGSLYCFASPQMAARVEVLIADRFNVLNSIRWTKDAGWHNKAEKESLRSFLSPWEEIIFAEHYGADDVAKGEAGYEAKCQELLRNVFQVGSLAERHGVTRSDIASLIVSDYKNIDSAKAQASNWILGKNIPNRVDFARLKTVLPIQGDYDELCREYEDRRREYEDRRRPFTVTADVPFTDVWNFAPVGAFVGKHPCEKPTALLSHMLRISSRPNAVALDVFMGSGSLLEAARMLGRRAIGIEREEQYCEIAAMRLSQGTLPLQSDGDAA